MPDNTDTTHTNRSWHLWVALLAALYILVVLAVDTLAAQRVQWPFPWSRLQWHLSTTFPSLRGTPWSGFDVYKFLFWLVIPFVLCVPRMDWRYLVGTRWNRWDLGLLAGLTVLGMAAMFVIPLVPELQSTYPAMGHLDAAQKWGYVQRAMVWNVSWVLGWEFLHRYMLLKAVQRAPLTGRWGLPGRPMNQWYWLAVPLSETVYHLQKPGIEALGMCAFSVVLTLWCLRRKNWLLPCLVHLIIEVELLVFMTLLQ